MIFRRWYQVLLLIPGVKIDGNKNKDLEKLCQQKLNGRDQLRTGDVDWINAAYSEIKQKIIPGITILAVPPIEEKFTHVQSSRLL
jgi:hypothetical protein